MEVCVESVSSALNAEAGGAVRLELCCNLAEGGITPTVGLLRVIKEMVTIPVFVMIRPRGGDFLYTDEEFEVMKIDASFLKEHGADGIVLGILQSNGQVDTKRTKKMIDLISPLPVTFHRAIDMTNDVFKALEDIISIGCAKVLTSGQDISALEGLPVIKKMVEQAKGRLIVIPAGGITVRNVERILNGSGAMEFHCSARTTVDSLMNFKNSSLCMGTKYGPSEYSRKITNGTLVRNILNSSSDCQ